MFKEIDCAASCEESEVSNKVSKCKKYAFK